MSAIEDIATRPSQPQRVNEPWQDHVKGAYRLTHGYSERYILARMDRLGGNGTGHR